MSAGATVRRVSVLALDTVPSHQHSPGTSAGAVPASRWRSSAGKAYSASPRTTWSTKGWLRCRAWPIGPSQLLPPRTTVNSGRLRLSSRARARDGTFCMKVLVNPTTSGPAASTSVAQASMKPAAYGRMARAVSMNTSRPAAYSFSRASPQPGSSYRTPEKTQSPRPWKMASLPTAT